MIKKIHDLLSSFMNNLNGNVYSSEQERELLTIVRADGMALRHAPDHLKTRSVCMKAVRQNGMALQYVDKQTEDLCLAAIRQDSRSIQFVKEKTEKLIIATVKKNGNSIQYIEKPSERICLIAVKNRGEALAYIKNRTPKVCLASVSREGNALRHVKDQTPNICVAAITENPSAIAFVIDVHAIAKYVPDSLINKNLHVSQKFKEIREIKDLINMTSKVAEDIEVVPASKRKPRASI